MRLNPGSTSPTFELLTANRSCPEIRFLKAAVQKQEEYVDLSPQEVGWMGCVEKINDLLYVVSDVFLLPQEVNGTKTHIDSDVWFQLDEQMSEKKLKSVRLWGHSHVNMACTASAEDGKTMETLALGVDWFIRAILNKSGVMKISFFNYEEGIVFHDCPWELPEDKQRDKLRIEVQEQLEEMVRPIATTYPAKVVNLANKPEQLKGEVYVNLPEVGSKMWDVGQNKLVVVRSAGHGRHLLGQMRKALDTEDADVERMIEAWIQGDESLLIEDSLSGK